METNVSCFSYKNETIFRKNIYKTLSSIRKCFIANALLFGILNSTLYAQDCPDALSEYCNIEPCFTSKVSITNAGYWKVITANGIPNHDIGIFPISYSDIPGCDRYYGRPSGLKEQDYTFVIPSYSSKGILWPGRIFEIPKPPFLDKPNTTFGVAVNGVPFDPVAAEWWDVSPPPGQVVHYPTNLNLNPIENIEMEPDLDCNNGHVQPDGGYHYHGFPTGLYRKIRDEQATAVNNQGVIDSVTRRRSQIVLLGWAFDGNPIYGKECGLKNGSSMIIARSSYRLRTPARTVPPVGGVFPMGSFVEDYEYRPDIFEPSKSVQLDKCNGHTGPTPEFPHGVYHYHVLEQFPYIGRCYRLFTYGQGPNIFPKPR